MIIYQDKFGHKKQIYEKEPFSKTNKADDIKDFRKVVAPSGSR